GVLPTGTLVIMSFPVYAYADIHDIDSFPTRRSSDLFHMSPSGSRSPTPQLPEHARKVQFLVRHGNPWDFDSSCTLRKRQRARPRSEEHTSELQSREKLVCRLLLEKKNWI